MLAFRTVNYEESPTAITEPGHRRGRDPVADRVIVDDVVEIVVELGIET